MCWILFIIPGVCILISSRQKWLSIFCLLKARWSKLSFFSMVLCNLLSSEKVQRDTWQPLYESIITEKNYLTYKVSGDVVWDEITKSQVMWLCQFLALPLWIYYDNSFQISKGDYTKIIKTDPDILNCKSDVSIVAVLLRKIAPVIRQVKEAIWLASLHGLIINLFHLLQL